MNRLNKDGFDHIKKYEGLRLNAYQDTGGVWTIGYGHTAAAGPPIPKKGLKITKEEAEKIFLRDLIKYENAVKSLVRVPINDDQYSALVSFCYNVGEGNLKNSTLLRKLNAKDYNGAANEFRRWNKDNGVVLLGLIHRRDAEEALFRSRKPVQKPSPVPSTQQPKNSSGFLGWLLGLLKTIFSGGQK